MRWSDRPFMLNQQKSHTSWKCTNEARWSDRSFILKQQKVTYILDMHKGGKIVRQIIHAQSTKDHIQAENAQTRQDGQTGHSCSINKRSHTSWKCTNKARWSDRSFMLNQYKVTYILEMHKQGKIVRQVIHAQSTKCHIQAGIDEMVRQVIYAPSIQGHIHPGNAQTGQDCQTGHSCSNNKRSHTCWKCTNEARLSDRSFMLKQQKVTYTLEMHK